MTVYPWPRKDRTNVTEALAVDAEPSMRGVPPLCEEVAPDRERQGD
jgi:hypothetical protein